MHTLFDQDGVPDFSYLEELNEIQRKAVETTEGPLIIIAGPGSGKTRVLTFRIAHLINKGIAPWEILALTFTNKAAKEMKERIQHIVGEEKARQLYMGTFHSVFSRILRIEAEHIGYPTNYTIYDTEDTKSLLKAIVKEQNLNADLYSPGLLYGRISNAKNLLITPDQYLQNARIQDNDKAANRPRIGSIYKIYANRCHQAGAMDFDDLLVQMSNLLTHHPTIAQKYQERFRYLLIDEFQDTNRVQYRIVKELAKKWNNVCVVGDDAQSIYAFRGATIENILNFKRDYPKCEEYKLEQNYRSTKNIVEIANGVIARNSNQIPKTIWTSNDGGQKTKLFRAANDTEEGRLVADSIFVERLRNHFRNEDFAILYRTNAQSRVIEEGLRKRGIPYQVMGGLSFYQRKEIKNLMAYCRLTVNHRDEEALRRVINYPTRGIGKTTLEKVFKLAADREVSAWEIITHIHQFTSFSTRAKQAISGFAAMIMRFAQKLSSFNAYELADLIGKESGLLTKLFEDKSNEGLARYENIQELYNSIQEFVDNKKAGVVNETSIDTDASLGAYLQEVSLVTELTNDEETTDRVKLMTIHAAKGLEFPCVYIIGLEEDLFPSKMSSKNISGLEEERRLFYVAITRAKQKLFLSNANQRYRHGKILYCQTSRFIEEISPFLIEEVGRKPNTNRLPNNSSYAGFKSSIQGNIRSAKQLNKRKTNQQHSSPIENFKPSDSSQIKDGQSVAHQLFGEGLVVKVDGRGDKRVAIVNFADYGEKRLLLRFAKLMIL